MKHFFFGLLFFFYWSIDMLGQVNLVPNGDFEDYSECPSNISQLYLATPWETPIVSSPDVYNTCSSNPMVSVPNNEQGSQQAYSGLGYAGIYCAHAFNPNYREYLHAKLVTPTEIGKAYVVEFWYSLADTVKLATDRLAVLFKTSYAFDSNVEVMPGTPQVENPIGNVLTEKDGWELFSQSFTADSAYTHINIGNFSDGNNTFTQELDHGFEMVSYYYIDSISVIEKVETTSKEDSSLYLPNTFTPNGDGVNDIFYLSSGITFKVGVYRLSIFNRWGQKLYETDDPSKGWDGKVNGKVVESGVYSVLIDGETLGGEIYKTYNRLSVLK